MHDKLEEKLDKSQTDMMKVIDNSVKKGQKDVMTIIDTELTTVKTGLTKV